MVGTQIKGYIAPAAVKACSPGGQHDSLGAPSQQHFPSSFDVLTQRNLAEPSQPVKCRQPPAGRVDFQAGVALGNRVQGDPLPPEMSTQNDSRHPSAGFIQITLKYRASRDTSWCRACHWSPQVSCTWASTPISGRRGLFIWERTNLMNERSVLGHAFISNLHSILNLFLPLLYARRRGRKFRQRAIRRNGIAQFVAFLATFLSGCPCGPT